ncbi:hypothetical protein STENM223S_02678 [Streptomyces tendae]
MTMTSRTQPFLSASSTMRASRGSTGSCASFRPVWVRRLRGSFCAASSAPSSWSSWTPSRMLRWSGVAGAGAGVVFDGLPEGDAEPLTDGDGELFRARLVLLGQMPADLRRGEPETAQLDRVPGLEALGVPVEVEDRRLDRVGDVPSIARRPLPPVEPSMRSRVPYRMTSVSSRWRWPERTSGTVPSTSRAAEGSWTTATSTGVPARFWSSIAEASRAPASSWDCSAPVFWERSGVNCGSPMPAKRRPATVLARPSSRTCTFLIRSR